MGGPWGDSEDSAIASRNPSCRASKANKRKRNVRVRAIRGNPKRAPLPKQRLLAQCASVPVTQNQSQGTNAAPNKEGTNPPPLRGFPSGPHSGEGAGEITRLPSVRSRGSISSKKVWAANDNKQGKTKTTRKQETKHTLPSSVQKRSEARAELKAKT